MRRLAGVHELLDGPLEDEAALRGNLRDLARINRWLGGTAASRRALDRLLAGRTVPHAVLDVGTGAADIPLALLAGGTRSGRRCGSRASTRAPRCSTRPGRSIRGSTRTPGLELLVSDGRSLPWPDRSFDVVHASLVLHHLEPPDALAFLREAARVARLGVVVNDLVRARHHWIGARVLLPLMTRNRYTRHDGPLSVLRAYTRMELARCSPAAALRPVAEFGAFAGHRVAIAAVPMREPSSAGARRTGRGRMTRGADAVVGGGPRGLTAAISPAPGTTSSCSSARGPGAGGPAGCSPRLPRSASCGTRGWTRRRSRRVARPIPAMRVETAGAARLVPADVRRRDRRRAGGRLRPVRARPGAARARRGGRGRGSAGNGTEVVLSDHRGRGGGPSTNGDRGRRTDRVTGRRGRRRPRSMVAGAAGMDRPPGSRPGWG